MKRHGLFLLCVMAVLAAIAVPLTLSQAQTPQELLTNNGMDNYYGLGGDKVVPLGWTLQSSIPINTAKQQWQFENQQYGGSWHLSTGSAAFSMMAYQYVPGIPNGTPLRFSIEANIFTCNQQTSCIGSDGHRTSETGSNARVRVGIDPTGGKDSASASIVWSAFSQPWDAFRALVIDSRTTSTNGATVFVNYTQDYAMLLNNLYLDNASLQVLGPGVTIGGTNTGGTAVPTVPAFVPFVTPQATQTDGSIIHIVREGDTLSSIAVAYGVTVAQIRELNNLPVGAFIQPGQKLIIRKGAGPIYLIVTATPEGTLPSTETITATPAASQPAPSGRPTFGPVLIPTRTPTQSAALPHPRALVIDPVRVLDAETASTGTVCLITFSDLNGNQYQDAGEAPLGSIPFVISRNAQSVREIATSNIRPACADGLSAGMYEIAANLPSNSRLTLGNPVEVDLKAGVELTITAGIAPSAEVQAAANSNAVVEALVSSVIEHSGVIVLAGAGLMLIGVVAVALLRR